MQTPGVFLLLLALLLNIFGKGLALKCHTCTCFNDCIKNGNINNVEQCKSKYNACLTTVGPGDKINKWCWIKRSGITEEPGEKPGETNYYCYEDLCNEGYYNTNGHSDGMGRSGSAGAGASPSTPKLTGIAFLMVPFTLIAQLIIPKITN